MATPTKPVAVLRLEKKSHRTERELQQREEAEKSLLTGRPMSMQKGLSAKAKKEFIRVKELLSLIDKDDALYEGIINRYAQIKSEIDNMSIRIKKQQSLLKAVAKAYAENEISFEMYFQSTQKAETLILSLDRQIQSKRKMLFDIEKENVMTVAAALRSVPTFRDKPKKDKNEDMFD